MAGRRGAGTGRWSDFVEDRTTYPILSHAGACIEAAIGQLLVLVILEPLDEYRAE